MTTIKYNAPGGPTSSPSLSYTVIGSGLQMLCCLSSSAEPNIFFQDRPSFMSPKQWDDLRWALRYCSYYQYRLQFRLKKFCCLASCLGVMVLLLTVTLAALEDDSNDERLVHRVCVVGLAMAVLGWVVLSEALEGSWKATSMQHTIEDTLAPQFAAGAGVELKYHRTPGIFFVRGILTLSKLTYQEPAFAQGNALDVEKDVIS